MTKKYRLDQVIVQQGLMPTREKAQAMILAGRVWVGDNKLDKCGEQIAPDSLIKIDMPTSAYVSRGGDKLAGAIEAFQIPLQNRVALDLGISTGGFTDYLFKNGVAKVIGVDVGYGQVDYKLRQDPRLHLIERTNARHLKASDIEPYLEQITLVVMDVSFISVTKILPQVAKFLRKDTDFIILIKPQFESQKSEIGKGGIIKDSLIRRNIIERVATQLAPHFNLIAECDSPITGTKGNQEGFFWLKSHR